MQRLTPFAWIDDDKILHLEADKVCDEMGWPQTPENLALASLELAEFAKKCFPKAPVLIRGLQEEKGANYVHRN